MKVSERVWKARAGLAVAGVLALGVLVAGAWPQPAYANAAHAAAGAAATSEANSCGAKFGGPQLYDCLGRTMDKLANRIDGQANIGTKLAGQIRTASAAIKSRNKQEAVAALTFVRSTISGFIGRLKGKGGRDETPGMNALSGAISTTIRLIQKKG